MSAWLHLAGVASALGGAWLLYLASDQQRWRSAGPWPARHRWLPGSAVLLLSLVLLFGVFAPGTACFAWLVWATLAWTAAPFLGAWRARRDGR